MRIEESVPGIKKERGKLPAPTALGPPKLAPLRAAGPPIWGEFVVVALCEPVTAVESVAVGWMQAVSIVSATANPNRYRPMLKYGPRALTECPLSFWTLSGSAIFTTRLNPPDPTRGLAQNG
jgi:hypothetical protein